MREHICPHIHELSVFWHFKEYGLTPYWKLRNVVIRGFGGEGEITADIDGDRYHIDIGCSDSGIAPRPCDPEQHDVYHDWEIKVNGPNEAKASYQIRARYDDMVNPNNNPISLPWPGGEGLDVLCQSTNISPDWALYLFRKVIDKLIDSVGQSINEQYFAHPEPTSRITTVEWYVRIARQYAKKIVRSDGIFHRVLHLLSPEEGMEWVYKGDNTDIIGHRHAMDLPPAATNKLGPAWSLGVRLKSYHPKYVRDDTNSDDPLSDPKFGIAYHKSIDGESRAWNNRDQIRRDIEELLINFLEWAGVPTEPDPTTFVADDHFTVEASDVSISRCSDPTPELEVQQESLLMTVLGELSPTAQNVTKLIANDGITHYTELAEETDSSISTIYRALNQLGELVESDCGMVRFTSKKIREDISGMVNRLEELKESTAQRVAELANIELRSSADSAMEKWMARYGAELIDIEGDGGTVRFDTLLTRLISVPEPNLYDVLREGVDAWESTGRNRSTFADLRIDARLRNGSDIGRRIGKIINEYV